MKNFTVNLNTDGILTIAIDVANEAMNVFNESVIEEFSQIADTIEQDNNIQGVIFISSKPNGFIAGADIKMLQKVVTAIDGSAISINSHQLLARISNSKKPHIAAIDGVCLGVGYELALACHYRIATDDPSTKLGLPEVMLGLLPGGGGNTKLPRLISLPAALDLLLTGKQLNAKRALRLGMIDEVVSKPILTSVAQSTAVSLIKKGLPERKRSFKDTLFTLPFIKDIVINKARQQVLQKTKGHYPAPLAILDVIKQGINKPLAEALEIEAINFGELTVSPEAKQLINIYFATTALKKESYTKTKQKKREIEKLGILGGGLMGAGIATVSIDKANSRVRLKDIRDEGIISAYQYISTFYQQRVKRRILDKETAKKKINQFTSSLTYTGFEDSDLVIEAVFEDLKIKHQMVKDIEALGNESTVFATNTSSIPISDIASQAKRPENIIGMHYFSPVEKMPLLEVIKHPGTSDQTIETAVEFGRRQGKTVIVVNDGAGFFVNRILLPYLNAAIEIGLEGAAFDKIDNALVEFGFPVGPFKLVDEVGLDVASKILPILESSLGPRLGNTGTHEVLIKNGRIGKKVKKGFYLYDDKKNNKTIDDSVYKELNITLATDFSNKNIVQRSIYRMLNEAAFCLQDNIINSPRDGDIGAIFGIGFPPFLGGPFRYMDSLGIAYVVDQLIHFEKDISDKYKPCPLLVKMAEANKTFY